MAQHLQSFPSGKNSPHTSKLAGQIEDFIGQLKRYLQLADENQYILKPIYQYLIEKLECIDINSSSQAEDELNHSIQILREKTELDFPNFIPHDPFVFYSSLQSLLELNLKISNNPHFNGLALQFLSKLDDLRENLVRNGSSPQICMSVLSKMMSENELTKEYYKPNLGHW